MNVQRSGGNLLNEKRIKQVLDVEKKAEAIYEAAIKEAAQIPLQAEVEAQTLIENSRAKAKDEAQKMIAGAQPAEENRRILVQSDEKIQQMDALTKANFSRAVTYILYRVAGKE